MKKALLIILIILFIFSGCTSGAKKREVVISAAASLQNALEEIENNYESEHKDIDLIFNFGGSGTLVTQIEEGAPVDICFLASKENYNTLYEEGKIKEGKDLLKNSLVVITNKDNPTTNIERVDKIAIGTPGVVPAGTYAKQTLESIGMWDKVQGNLVQTKDVTEVLSYVATNNVDLGIVYETDALSSPEVDVVLEVDESLHDTIVYPIGLLTENQDAKDFYEYLQTNQAMEAFERYGFIKNDK